MKTNTAYRFTDAEMETARETELPDLLESLGYHVQQIGAYHTTKEMDSLRIKNRRTWYRYSEGTGGDAITFLQRFCNKSFQEAVEYLLDYHGRARDSPARPTRPIQTKEERVPFVLPPANTDHRRVFAYLRKRGIAPQVIRAFLRSGLLYEDAQHHNCVFVGRDAAGTPRFASCRGTYDRNGPGFKGDVAGSDKRIAFRLPSKPDLDWVLVFEAPIDRVGAKSISLRFRLRRKLRSIPLLLLFPSDPLRWAPMGALPYDLLQSHTARTMLANSEFLVMLNQASTDRAELAKLLNISDNQLSYISNVDFGRGLLKCGSAIVPFLDNFPKNRLYHLMTTRPSEVGAA